MKQVSYLKSFCSTLTFLCPTTVLLLRIIIAFITDTNPAPDVVMVDADLMGNRLRP